MPFLLHIVPDVISIQFPILKGVTFFIDYFNIVQAKD